MVLKVEKQQELISNNNFRNNQNYIVSHKNRCIWFKDKKHFDTIFLLTVLILLFFATWIWLVLWWILKELLNIWNDSISVISIVISIVFILYFFRKRFLNFLLKWSRYFLLIKDPNDKKISYSDKDYNNLDKFIILESKKYNYKWYKKFNFLKFMVKLILTIFFAIPTGFTLYPIFYKLWLHLRTRYLLIISFIISFVLYYYIITKITKKK